MYEFLFELYVCLVTCSLWSEELYLGWWFYSFSSDYKSIWSTHPPDSWTPMSISMRLASSQSANNPPPLPPQTPKPLEAQKPPNN
eukprot:599241-Amphidinium_carterae.1